MSDRRIVFVTLSPGVWGAERSMLTLAAALIESGASIHLICSDERVASAWRDATGLTAHMLPPQQGSRLGQITNTWKQLSLLTGRNDVLVLFSYVLAPGAITPRRWPNGRPSVALDLHDTLTPGFGRVALATSALGIRSIISVSRFTAAQVIRVRSKVTVLTRPVEPLPFHEVTLGARMTVGVLGRITPEKRPELLIEAARSIVDVDVVVRGEILQGEDDYASHVRSYGSATLGTRFRMEPPRAWADALDGLDVLVVANDKEPMGRTVLEAQLSGVVALVPDQGGASELVEDGRTGFRYEAGSAGALAAALRRTLRADLAEVARNAREHAMKATDAPRYALSYREALGV